MPATIETLPIQSTLEPTTAADVSEMVRSADNAETPVYPIGGGTSLNYGLPARATGVGLSLANLNRVVDYPARDMTITVDAGVTMSQLAKTLAAERQQLPVDVPSPDQATIGGVIATAWNGPRRYGYGSIRDFVIGISAVDGRGTQFKGGGRVVKNVAGYDFCKLLTGSLGTLGVITQVTLKLRPNPERSILVACELFDESHAERILSAMVHSQTTPAAIELVAGPKWQDLGIVPTSSTNRNLLCLIVGLEGTKAEVDWMQKQLSEEWHEQNVTHSQCFADEETDQLWRRLAGFSADDGSALVLKATVAPSGTTAFIRAVRETAGDCSIQAHAGNGIVIASFPEFPEEGLSRTLIARLQPVAARHQGNVVVLSNPGGAEMTPQSVWGGHDSPVWLMSRVKQQFDPNNILNPGRFVYR